MVGLGSTAFFSHSDSGHRKLLGVGRDKGLESRPGTRVEGFCTATEPSERKGGFGPLALAGIYRGLVL